MKLLKTKQRRFKNLQIKIILHVSGYAKNDDVNMDTDENLR